jgi:hypothetical protein
LIEGREEKDEGWKRKPKKKVKKKKKRKGRGKERGTKGSLVPDLRAFHNFLGKGISSSSPASAQCRKI